MEKSTQMLMLPRSNRRIDSASRDHTQQISDFLLPGGTGMVIFGHCDCWERMERIQGLAAGRTSSSPNVTTSRGNVGVIMKMLQRRNLGRDEILLKLPYNKVPR